MKQTIMVVEDEVNIQKDIARFFELNDFEVLTASDGEEALQIVEKVLPDLIICDILMPKMDGYELLEEMQKTPETANIPFLFLTAKIERKDQRFGMEVGADDYITKPFNYDELIRAAQSRLKKKENTEKIYEQKFDEIKSTVQYALPHELKNPLNVILGFTDILKHNIDKVGEKEAVDMLDNIYKASLRLNKLFENYVLMANLELTTKDDEELFKKLLDKTHSAEVIIIDSANKIARERERENDLELESIEDASIYISPQFFSKVMTEIIDNAFKFSKYRNKVKISAKKDKKSLVITVKDKGRGIRRDQLKRIGKYVQFERKLYEQQGIGLGAALAKRLVETHKGVFKIESEPDAYTKVTIKLPLVKE